VRLARSQILIGVVLLAGLLALGYLLVTELSEDRSTVSAAAGATEGVVRPAGSQSGMDERPTSAEPAAGGPEPKLTPKPVAPSATTPVVAVKRGSRARLRAAPGGELVRKLGPETEFSSPTVLSVQRRRGDWLGVPTPHRPNGRLGWVRMDQRQLEAGSVDDAITIDLSKRKATWFSGGRVERSWTVTIGGPDTPTPIGRFAVTDTLRGDLDPAYGCCAVALTARQPSLPPGWPGGDRIAIHGTTDSVLGQAISNGCIRSADADVAALIGRVEPGTPVRIRN